MTHARTRRLGLAPAAAVTSLRSTGGRPPGNITGLMTGLPPLRPASRSPPRGRRAAPATRRQVVARRWASLASCVTMMSSAVVAPCLSALPPGWRRRAWRTPRRYRREHTRLVMPRQATRDSGSAVSPSGKHGKLRNRRTPSGRGWPGEPVPARPPRVSPSTALAVGVAAGPRAIEHEPGPAETWHSTN